MKLFLNLLLILIGILGAVTRVLELEYLENNLELRLVSDPILLGIIFLIIVCASILICTNKSFEKFKVPTFQKTLSLLTGFTFITYYFMNYGSSNQLDIFMLLAGIGFVFYSFTRDKNSIVNLLYIIPLSAFIIGLSLQTILFNVSSTNNTIYLFESLCSSVILLFLVALFRSVNYPTASSFSSLYVFGMATFLLTNATYLASGIYSILSDDYTIPGLTLNLAFTLLGIFTASMSINVSKKAKTIHVQSEIQDIILDNSIALENENDEIDTIDKESAVLSLFTPAKENTSTANEEISAQKEETPVIKEEKQVDYNNTHSSTSGLFTLKLDNAESSDLNSEVVVEKEEVSESIIQSPITTPTTISSLFTLKTDDNIEDEVLDNNEITKTEDELETTQEIKTVDSSTASISSLFTIKQDTNYEEIPTQTEDLKEEFKAAYESQELIETEEFTETKEDILSKPRASISSLFSSDELEIIDKMKVSHDNIQNDDLDDSPSAFTISQLFSSNENNASSAIALKEINEAKYITIDTKEEILDFENEPENKISSIFTLSNDEVIDKKPTEFQVVNSDEFTDITPIDNQAVNSEEVVSYIPNEISVDYDTTSSEIPSTLNPSDSDVLMNFLNKELEKKHSPVLEESIKPIKKESSTTPDSSLIKSGEKFIFKADSTTPKKSKGSRILFKKD